MEPQEEKQEKKEAKEGKLKEDTSAKEERKARESPPFVDDFEKQREEIRAYERSKVERKRNREKQRRTEVTSGLDALLELMYVVDPRVRVEVEERATKVDGSRGSGSDASALSRVELIHLAISTLERIHQENEERKLVIDRLAKALLSIEENGNNASLPGAPGALPRDVLPSVPAARDIQQQLQRQAHAQQQLELEAFAAASLRPSGLSQPLHGDFRQEAATLGLGPSRGHAGTASLARSPPSAPDTSLGGMNPAAAASFLGASSLPHGFTDGGLSLLNDREGLGRGNPDYALYRALMNFQNQRRQEEEAAALAAAGLGPGGRGAFSGVGILQREDPSILSRGVSDRMSPRERLSGDSIRQQAMREQTIAQAAAANAALENQGGFPMKRFKGHHA